MPTSTHTEEEIDEMYEYLERLIDTEKGKDNIMIIRDWNAVVGEGIEGKVFEQFDLGRRNERGENWMNSANTENL